MNRQVAFYVTLVLAVVVGLAIIIASQRGEIDQQGNPKAVALDFVNALFASRDSARAAQLIDPNAKHGDPAIADVGAKLTEEFGHDPALLSGDLRQVLFISSDDVENLQAKYPGDMWNPDRLPAHMASGTACLAIVEVPTSESTVRLCIGIVVESVQERHRITYIDDVDLPLETDAPSAEVST